MKLSHVLAFAALLGLAALAAAEVSLCLHLLLQLT